MIKKARKTPLKIRKLDALMRRVSNHHPARSKINEEFKKSKAGFRGERSLDYYLSAFNKNDCFIFHDLRLQGENNTIFQLDTLILSSCFVLILEIKNIVGTLLFDQVFHQLIRTTNDQVNVFPDPLLQINKQSKQFEQYLQKFVPSKMPIISYIIISNPSSQIKASSNSDSLSRKVIHAASLPDKILLLEEQYSLPILSSEEMEKVTTTILKDDTPLNPDVMKQFNICTSQILTGVHCPVCNYIPLERIRGGWWCEKCNNFSKIAYLFSLIDYLYLIKPTITNREFRNFFHIPSIFTASRLLNDTGLSSTGSFKDREYMISEKKLQIQPV
ncbi:nuclease-related domain-containing protein [Bacillus spongiae]|uniref:Nuclease-related domain-containing protein n=1 Tax=Bacillus spongiae TaxID=2683610 RepID=A0ABU8HCF5_9BACI